MGILFKKKDKKMKYSANYDKYPFVQVSYNSDDCISGWFAITDSISERLKVLEKPLKVVVIECYQKSV